MLPDSLPYLPVKEQKELPGGCLQGRQLPQWAWLRRAAKIPRKEGSLGHQHWLEGWNLTVVFCQGKDHCFLSGTEAIVPGDFVSPVSRDGLGWACPRGLQLSVPMEVGQHSILFLGQSWLQTGRGGMLPCHQRPPELSCLCPGVCRVLWEWVALGAEPSS